MSDIARNNLRIVTLATYLAGLACFHELAAEEPTNTPKNIEGLWSGSWGYAVDANGVVHQPAMAELLIKGDHAELYGFPKIDRNGIAGTVRFDANTKQMHITPTAATDERPAKSLVYTYQIKADELSLTAGDQLSISLRRHRVVQQPLANVQIQLVEANGINAAGDLLVTEFRTLRVGRSGSTSYQPNDWSRKTTGATVLLVQESGCKSLTIDEARRRIHQPTLVAISYRSDHSPERSQFHQLWKNIGPPPPDSEAVRRTFSHSLRPGTLVFILSAYENRPQP